MATNPAAKMVGALIARAVTPVLKPLGFKRSGTTFRRALDECTQVVNVQSSQWNDRTAAQFTINLGVFFPAMHVALADFYRADISASGPLEYQCHVRQRIDGVLPAGRDTWWTLRPGESGDAVATDVEAALRGPAVQWFERYPRPAALLTSAEPESPMSLLGAALVAGDDVVARRVASELVRDRPNATALIAWLERLGLTSR